VPLWAQKTAIVFFHLLFCYHNFHRSNAEKRLAIGIFFFSGPFLKSLNQDEYMANKNEQKRKRRKAINVGGGRVKMGKGQEGIRKLKKG
jgi:hypothetical protein